MEASSTTLNITGSTSGSIETAAPVAVTHNHGPNFGRYVANCPKCVQQYPDGPPKKKPASSKKDAEIAALKAQLAEVVAAKSGITTGNATDQLVQLMLADQAEKLREKEIEKARRALAREQDVIAAKQQEAQKLAVQAACNHTKENGRTAIAQSQVHNDGFLHPFCMRCQKTFPLRRPAPEQMSTSVEA